MELKRLLTRATALLLQGAYQGAESFIEQAMAEADKLKSELAELDTLRTRVTEMASEVERLQSVIDEANAQEPDAVESNNGSVMAKHDFADIEDFLRSCRNNTPLYKRPIPAQQSPENKKLTFYGNVNVAEAIAIVEQQSPAVAAPDETISEAFFRGYKEAAKEYTESPRITEQDAREIVTAWVKHVDDHDETVAIPDFEWSHHEWKLILRTLLNKLNGDQNGK